MNVVRSHAGGAWRVIAVTVILAVAVSSGCSRLWVNVAGFNAVPASGRQPLAVRFTPAARGSIAGWFWDFGDGATSTERAPQHIYVEAGTYTVSMTVDPEWGAAITVIKEDFIVVTGGLGSTPDRVVARDDQFSWDELAEYRCTWGPCFDLDVLANDTAGVPGAGLTLVGVKAWQADYAPDCEADHGMILVSEDGTHLTYIPYVQGSIGDEVFSYRVTDGQTAAEAQVTITEGSSWTHP